MRIDWYTKTVLTVIAACLVWMCVKDTAATTVSAAPAAQDVVIVGWRASGEGGALVTLPSTERNMAPIPVTR